MTSSLLRTILCWCALTAALELRADGGRERRSLDRGWRFAKGDPGGAGAALAYARVRPWLLVTRDAFLGRPADPPAGPAPAAAYAAPDFDDHSWRQLDLPHDWGIEGPFDPHAPGATGRLPFYGVGWYRRHLPVGASEAGRRFYLEVDGAMSYSEVWLNGRFVGGWPYGYSSFELDLTPYLRTGDNVLAIRLDNPPASSRWYPGGGIYRNVWLVETSAVHVAHWGTFVTTPQVTAQSATVHVAAEIENDGPAPVSAIVRTQVFALGPNGRPDGDAISASAPVTVSIGAGARRAAEQALAVGEPMLWSVRSPYRYVAVTTVEEGGRTVDRYETPFGIRTIAFDPSRGFLLNGEHLKFQGVCDHADLGALGTAIDPHALERQLSELRDMGCNAIRTSHNPPAPELLDLCDRMGFLVMDEAFDCWVSGKTPNDYHRLFPDWHEADLRALVERDRNHPSVIMWSIGNEIPDQTRPDGPRLARELVRIVHDLDSTRPATSACNKDASTDNGFGDALDLYGFNYRWYRYGEYRRHHPYKFVFGSETDSTVSTRGVYVFPISPDKLDGLAPGWQVSSYDLYAPKWAHVPDDEFRAEDEYPEVGGQFTWTGWDYLGEPTPYGNRDDPARSSYFGIIDLAGFPKDRYYLYQANWRRDLPMAHLVPHWTWPDRVGKVTPVFVYTSGDSAELFLNGRSLGWRRKGPGEYRLRWDHVVYEPGILKVVAYKDGKVWAEASERTAGPAAALRLETDRAVLPGRRQLAFVSASIVDQRGTLCPDASNLIHFHVDGPARVIAVDNGDPTSFAPFQAAERRAFHGLALAIVRSGDEPGDITVSADSPGLAPAQVELRAEPASD